MNRRALILVLPLLGAAMCYGRALRGGFVFDDLDSVLRDPAARSLSVSTRMLLPSLFSTGRALSNEAVASAHLGDHKSTGLEGGRGFVAWTLALNHAVGGLDPFGYHVVNLGLHLVVTLLVFFFTRTLLGRAAAPSPEGCAVAVAGLFVLHPLHSQAVNYITQRAEVIASGAYLGALLLLLRASSARGLSAALLVLSALLVFAVGLGAKVIVVTMPAAYLLLMLVVPEQRPDARRPGWARHLVLTAPFFLLAAWKTHALLASVKGHTDAGFGVSVRGLNAWTYFMTEWKVILVYVRLLFWPAGQNLDWLYPVSTRLDLGVTAAGATLLAGVALAVVLVGRARRLDANAAPVTRVIAFGVLWFLLVLAPTSSFVPLADLLVEHRSYLASVGLLAAAVVLGERLAARFSARSGAVAIAVAWLALGLALWRRNAVWESPAALWADVVTKQPGNGRAHTALATIYQGHGDLANAIREYGLALQRMADGRSEDRQAAMEGMAAALVDAGRPHEAMTVIRVALAIQPGDPTMLATLAAVQLRVGDFQNAERAAQAALTAHPRHSQALLTLGEARLLQEDAAGAVHYLSQAVAVEPNEPIRLLEYGRALAQLGRREAACQTWRAAAQSPEARDDDRNAAAMLADGLGCPPASAPGRSP